MKKYSKSLLILLLIICMGILFVGCYTEKNDKNKYTISYTDNNTTIKCEVTYGLSYNITTIPTKVGYSFNGLVDTDGKKYVGDDGVSLFAWDVKENKTLQCEWIAKTYIVFFDAQGAKLDNSSCEVEYDKEMIDLPYPSKENYNFIGWFSEAKGKGTQLTNKSGFLPQRNKFCEKYYKINDNECTIYAYFEIVKYNITFYHDNSFNSISEVKQVPHGEKITMYAPKLENGQTIVSEWSTSKTNGAAFVDIITNDIALYPLTRSPYIEIFKNNGEENLIVSEKIGSAIIIENPIKENATFVGWFTDSTCKTTFNGIMPDKKINIYALWEYEKIKVTLERRNCLLDNGYNPSQANDAGYLARHANFELGELIISNCTKNADGKLSFDTNHPIKLQYKLLEDITNLPINNNDIAYQRLFEDQQSAGNFSGTNLNGKAIGMGAYYLKVTYKNGTTKEINAVNFMKGHNKNDYIDLNLNLNDYSNITSIDVIVLYELQFGGQNIFWWSDYTNWQCITTLYFI